MIQRDKLVAYLADLLTVNTFSDYAPNGLQVEGRGEIKTIIGGVTACQALVDAAVQKGADALLVHHGYFWKGESACVTGMKKQRLGALLANDINLLAYHLPLDAHPELGNNAQLAQLLGLQVDGSFGGGSGGVDIGQYGRLEQPLSAKAFAERLAHKLGRKPLHINGGLEHAREGGDEIHTIAWCTGAAQSYLEQAAALGVDAFLTGEISEQTVHVARELGIHFFSAGHHATERGGVQALGGHLAEKFGVSFEFVDIDNPV
ncbi:MAG: Nif3-like dinuclear metal center hexameric protein [Ectothiorhodospiraceae bacterium]|nr:Nif3-like dinuclear metal center hexameric protein [Ectothiorhodospiraceae bacterium]